MTPERLAAIKARLDAATPGPWQAHLSNTPPHYRAGPVVSHKFGSSGDRLGRFVLWEGDPEQADEDALLIANAPDDLAALLAYVEQLEGLLRDLCEDSRAAAEVVRLRGAALSALASLEKVTLDAFTMGRIAAIAEGRTILRDALAQSAPGAKKPGGA